MQGVSNAYRQRNVIEGIEFVEKKGYGKEQAICIMQELCDTTDADGFRVFRTYLEFSRACVIFGWREYGRHWDEKCLSQDEKAIQKRCRLEHIKTFLRSELEKRGLCAVDELVM